MAAASRRRGFRRRFAVASIGFAALVLGGAAAGAAAVSPRWGPATVVAGDPETLTGLLRECPKSTRFGICGTRVLEDADAADSAVLFLRLHRGFLSGFTEVGVVDVGEFRSAAVGAATGVVLLNGRPDLLNPAAAVAALPRRDIPGASSLREGGQTLTVARFPDAARIEHAAVRDGRETVVVQVALLDQPGCRRCATGYHVRAALRFGPTGKLASTRALSVCLDVDASAAFPAPSCPTASERSFVQSVPTPAGLFPMRFSHLVTNALLALAIVLVVVFASELFNSTLEANYERMTAPIARLRRRVWRPGPRHQTGRRAIMLFAATTALVSVLYCFLDPTFGEWDQDSLALYLGILSGLVLVTAAFDTAAVRTLRRRRARASVRASGAAVPIAVLCVLVSRAAGFQPGYLLGAIGGLTFAVVLSETDQGRLAARSAAGALGVSLVAWLVRTPVADAAASGSSLGLDVLDATLAAVVVAGIEGVAVAILPVRSLAGEQVVAWSRAAWAALFGLAVAAFVFVLLNPTGAYVGRDSVGAVWSVAILLGGFTVLSLGMWVWFRLRPHRPEPAPGQGSPERVTEPTGG